MQQNKPTAKNAVKPVEKDGRALTAIDPAEFAALTPAKQQEVLSKELFGTAAEMEVKISEYGKKCVVNAIVATQSYLRQNDKTFANIDLDLFRLSLYSVAITELNCAANPSEAYVELRGNVLAIKPQGAGNEALVRRFGAGIKPKTGLHNAWLVREGDEFTMPQFNGLEVTPPKWIPKFGNLSGKVLMVVYPVEKENGDVEYLMADRAGVISNIVAQCRQNAQYAFIKKDANGNPLDAYGNLAYPKGKYRAAVDTAARDAYYQKINELAEQANGDLDKFLGNEAIAKYINPTYTSFSSREAMIVRKMKNNALKQFPKDYESSIVAEAAKMIDEDRDETLDEQPEALRKPIKRDVIEVVEGETMEQPTGEKIQDFTVDEDTGEVSPTPMNARPQEKKEEKANKAGPTNYNDLR